MNLDLLTASRYFKVYDWYNKNFDNDEFMKSISPNQISSKIWLIEELKKTIPNTPLNVEIVGGWFGWPLIGMLYDSFDINKIFMYDIDKNACRVAIQYREIFNKNKDDVWVLNENYWLRKEKRHTPNLVINCSSEHMEETFYELNNYNKNCIFAIQSNNMFDEPDHINCSKNIDELINKNKIKKVLYSGEINFNDLNENNNYKRFMVIGKI